MSRVGLILTALPEFAPRGRDSVLLGEWCQFNEAGFSPFARAPVMESPWLQPGALHDAFEEAEQTTERLLARLAEYLNRSIATDYSLRAWRIVLGPWLQRAVHMMLDRWIHLHRAAERYRDFDTRVMPSSRWLVPRDYPHFKGLAGSDEYNHQLMSMLLGEMDLTFPSARLSFRRSVRNWLAERRRRSVPSPMPAPNRRPAQLGESALFFGFEKRNAAMHGEVFGSLTLPTIPERDVAWNVSGAVDPRPVFDGRRTGLAAIAADGEFERAFVRCLPWLLPALYLEGLPAARDAVCRSHADLPALVVSNNHGWWGKETFKFVAAEAVQRGARVVNIQSSGVHGPDLLSPQRAHESAVADRYFAWGWGEGGKYSNLPSLYASRFYGREALRPSPETSSIVFLQLGPVSRYPRWLWSCPAAGGRPESYVDFQLRFLKALPADAARRLVFRFKSGVDNGQSLERRVKAAAPGVVFETRPVKAAVHWLLRQDVRLVILDHISTTLFEVLAANMPTIIFVDPTQTMLSPRARVFDALADAGVFFTSPEEAASQVAKVYPNPYDWWLNHDIQVIRAAVVALFGQSSPCWREQWCRELTAEYQTAVGMQPSTGAN